VRVIEEAWAHVNARATWIRGVARLRPTDPEGVNARQAKNRPLGDGHFASNAGRHGGGPQGDDYPRPTKGIFVAITVRKSTFASGGRLAM
jgi:hypothetical protein